MGRWKLSICLVLHSFLYLLALWKVSSFYYDEATETQTEVKTVMGGILIWSELMTETLANEYVVLVGKVQ